MGKNNRLEQPSYLRLNLTLSGFWTVVLLTPQRGRNQFGFRKGPSTFSSFSGAVTLCI